MLAYRQELHKLEALTREVSSLASLVVEEPFTLESLDGHPVHVTSVLQETGMRLSRLTCLKGKYVVNNQHSTQHYILLHGLALLHYQQQRLDITCGDGFTMVRGQTAQLELLEDSSILAVSIEPDEGVYRASSS